MLAVDHDPASVEAAHDNARVNGVDIAVERVDLRRDDVPGAPTAVANLVRPMLLELAPRLPAGIDTLIAGGLLPGEADEVGGRVRGARASGGRAPRGGRLGRAPAPDMSESLDVAVIGAGHNGLVAAAYLARAGLSVEVFERRDIVGGACVTEELWPGVRASPGAYSLALLRRRIIDELDLRGHGLHVETHDPVAFAPFPDGRRLIEWSDVDRTHAQIERDWSRADADAYRDWAHRWDELAARAQPLMLENASRERWAEAVGEEILSGSMLDELPRSRRPRSGPRSRSRD